MYSENTGLMFIGFIWAFIVALLILILVCIIIHFLIIFKYFMQPYWIWNEFSGCFHQFVSLIFSIYFSQFEQLKKKKTTLSVQKSLFPQFASWKRNQNKYSKIRNLRLVKLSDEFVNEQGFFVLHIGLHI